MLKKILILSLIFIYTSYSLKAQNPKTDTLIKKFEIQKDNKIKTDLLKKISLKYFKNNQYQISNEYAKKGLKLLSEENIPDKIYFWDIISENFIKLSEFDKSYIYIKKILDNATKINDKHYEGNAYLNLMKVYWKQGKYDKAAETGIKAANIFEKLKDTENLDIAKLDIALIYIDLQDLDAADKIFDDFLSKKKQKDTLLIAGIYEKKGVIQFYKNNFSSARFFYNKALNLYNKLNDELSAAVETGNIAETYEAEKKYSKALKLYNEAIKTEKKHNYSSGLIFLYEATGKLYTETKQYRKAEQSLNKALYYIKKTKETRELPNIYNLFQSLYAKTGNYKKAYKYSLKKEAVKDSLTGEKVQNQINSIRIKYETEKAEKENTFLKKEQEYQKGINKRQSYIIIIISLLLFFIILFSILQYRLFLKNKKIKNILSEKNKKLNEAYTDIKQNIKYAGKIQNVMLLTYTETLKEFSEFIIFYKPAYTLSGDFYWSKKINDTVFVAVGDSTGHGVPGALLSITGMSFLNEIVTEDFIQTDVILNNLRNKIKFRLNQNGNENKSYEGWDISIFSVNLKTKQIQFSGAYNHLYSVSNKNIEIYKADRQPVGIYPYEKPFTKKEFKTNKNDIIWMFTDGFKDQLNTNMKKFGTQKFKELLVSISDKDLPEQKNILKNEFYKWKGDFKQIDDILLLGIKI